MSNSYSLKEKVVKGSVIVLILTLLGSICAYLIRILLSHTLSIENYGLFYATFGLFSAATVYTDLGFGYSIVYFLPKYLKIKNYLKAWNIYVYGLTISLAMAAVISIILIIIAPFLAKNYLKVPGSEILIYIFCAYLIAFTIINSLVQVYSGMQKEKYYSSITAFRWFLTLFFSILFILFGFSDIVFYAISWVLGHTFTASAFLFLLFYKHSFLTKNKLVWEGKIFKLMFSFALPSISETFVSSIIVLTVTFFLTLFKGVREVGIYNIIYPLALIPVILLAPINTLLLPLVSHLMEGEKDKMRYLIEKILTIIPFIGLYFALFIIIFPSPVVGLIFGQKWLGLVEIPLTILSLGTIAILMNGILGAITSGIGKIREKLKVTTITAIISIILGVFFIWYYGVLGAAIITSLTMLLMNILFVKIIKTIILFQIPYLFYLKLLIFSSVIYTLIKVTEINPKSWFEFIGFGIIYTIIFIIFGYIIKIYDKQLITLLLPHKGK